MPTHPTKILTLNSGSSSIKFSIYQMADGERLLLSGKLERIGLPEGHVEISGESVAAFSENRALPDHASAIRIVFDQLRERGLADDLSAIGHRVVMGGPRHTAPQRVTPELVQELNALCRIDPPHMPAALKTIEAAGDFRPGIFQVACFDTSFHRTMPKVAQTYALPRVLVEQLGIIRYGFHGLSYEYILAELRRLDPIAAKGKIIIAHLGNGASMAALCDAKSVETTMGFTPAGGLVMSSRSGDLDPGVLSYLMTQKSMSGTELNDLIYKESGLRGLSGFSSDMQDLTREKDRNPHAEEAIALFCYQAKKFMGGLVAVLDGVETVIFTGGIGENSSVVRELICKDLSYLGLHVDSARNEAHAEIISSAESRITVRVIKTNEELMIARHTNELLGATGSK
jgi:acetate kinase